MGDVQEQRPSGIADTHPYLGKPDGFLWMSTKNGDWQRKEKQ